MNIIIAIGLIVIGGSFLVLGGELLVRGASRLATILQIPQLIIGLTIVAACTGAPELTVSLMSCFKENGSPDMALGNVVGSGICNILLILGIAALIKPLTVSSQLIKREMPIMVVVSFLLWGVIAFSTHSSSLSGIIEDLTSMELTDLQLSHWSGFIFFGLYVFYCIWMIWQIRKCNCNALPENGAVPSIEKKVPTNTETDTTARKELPVGLNILFSLVLIAGGLGLLIYGADWFIDGAVRIAEMIGVSKLVIGLTVCAVGTSLPELVVSVIAVLRGRTDLAIGNVVGSNTFNILVVLGVTAIFVPNGIPVSHQAVYFDIPVMIAVAILGTWFCTTQKKLSRIEGMLMVLFYVSYIVTLFFFGSGM